MNFNIGGERGGKGERERERKEEREEEEREGDFSQHFYRLYFFV